MSDGEQRACAESSTFPWKMPLGQIKGAHLRAPTRVPLWQHTPSGWPANSCLAAVPTGLQGPPPSHPLQHLPVWMAAAFSGALNGPQSAGEIRMLGARDGGGGRGVQGVSVCRLEHLNGLLESDGCLGVGWMPLGLLFRLCGGGCVWVCLAGQDVHLSLLKAINIISGIQNQTMWNT